MLSQGATAPDFTLPRDGGASVTLSALRPGKVVLYFYPKDDTPGCTLEAQDFTARLADFTAAAHLSCLDYISDVDWNRSAAVKDWYAKVKSRPSFRTLLAYQVPGFPPPQHYADLDF